MTAPATPVAPGRTESDVEREAQSSAIRECPADADTLVIAITGHRPGDFGRHVDLRALAAETIRRGAARAKSLGRSKLRVVTGGALGTDQELAEAAARMPEVDGIAVEYSVIIPFPVEVMGRYWKPADRSRLERLIAGAVEHRIITDAFAHWAYHARNAAMVDVCEFLVAFWNGKRSGGTYSCLKYALLRKRPAIPTYNALADFRPIAPGQL